VREFFGAKKKMENLGKHLQGGLAFTENDVISHATDVFKPIAQEVSMTGSTTLSVRPVSLNQAGPYEFRITQKGHQYIKLNATRMLLRFKIVRADGTDIVAADGVGVCNLFPNSFFKTIEVEIGGKIIPALQNTHANYKAYLETILSYGFEAKTTHLRASMFHMDEADAFEDLKYHVDSKTLNTVNDGLRRRREMLCLSRVNDAVFPIHCDFFNTDKLLPPGVDLTLKFTRESEKFLFMYPATTSNATKTFKIQILDMKLMVKYVSVAPAIIDNHMRQILTQPILLPMKKTEIKSYSFAPTLTNIRIDSMYFNSLPKTLIVGMVATESYNGDTGTNPYNFQHFNVNYVQITHNGKQIPSEAYTPDFSENTTRFAIEYRGFYDNIGIGTDNLGTSISPDLYKAGCTLFAWDLTPDSCNGFHWHKMEAGGAIDLDLRFSKGLEKSITVLVFGVFDGLVAINKDMDVEVTFS
jgi:hypothetical protein